MSGSHTTDPDLAQVLAYHEASKHRLDRFAAGPHGLDWANQPDPFRTFAGAPRISLPLLADSQETTFAAVRRGERPPPRPMDWDSLAILFELSLGLSAWKEQGGARWALRCNPSSGNLHPTEGYLIAPALPGLEAGVHHYVSRDHAFERRATAPSPDWIGGVVVALTGIHWREAWKYGIRAYRYCQHDCGHALAALAYAAAALGWEARWLPGWGDETLVGLLGLDRAEDFRDAEPEAPEAALWIGPPGDGDEIEPPSPEGLAFAGRANRLSPAQVAWEGIEAVDEAARRSAGLAVQSWNPPSRPPLSGEAGPESAAGLIRQRRSAVDFDGETHLPAAKWFAILDALLPRPGVPPLDAWPLAPRVHPLLFVHRVEGIDPGLCLLVRDETALPALKEAIRGDWDWTRVEQAPAHLPLYRLAVADTREAAAGVSCGQDIAADSCFAVAFLTEFAAPLRGAPWVYRELFWETGVLGQVLYLEAEAAGVRGTGIGCFFDDALHGLVGLEGRAWQSLYHFTVGGAVEDVRLRVLPCGGSSGPAGDEPSRDGIAPYITD